jgi:hypothetical protein
VHQLLKLCSTRRNNRIEAAREFSNAAHASTSSIGGKSPGPRFVNIHRSPDIIRVYTAGGDFLLQAGPGSTWSGKDVQVTTPINTNGTDITLSAPQQGVSRIHLRWNSPGQTGPDDLYLGDAWERAYGDLSWRTLGTERVMPWYFIASDGVHSYCYGVKTGPSALCFRTADADGISLWADVRSGGTPLQLGGRTLQVATNVTSRDSAKCRSDEINSICAINADYVNPEPGCNAATKTSYNEPAVRRAKGIRVFRFRRARWSRRPKPYSLWTPSHFSNRHRLRGCLGTG